MGGDAWAGEPGSGSGVANLFTGAGLPGHEHRQILRSAQWGLAAMPAPISFGPSASRRRLGHAQPVSCSAGGVWRPRVNRPVA